MACPRDTGHKVGVGFEFNEQGEGIEWEGLVQGEGPPDREGVVTCQERDVSEIELRTERKTCIYM